MASLVWGCCRLIGAMPHWLRYYVLQDTIYFIVYKCLRYRVGVVTENLRNSFPDRPMAEIKRIRRSFYHNLSEIFISTVSQAAMSDDDCRRRVRVKNLDEVLSDLRGRDTVFFDGIEKMALKFHMPVYFCRQRRLRRGYYELEFLRLYDGVEQVAPNEVTERYVRQLESDIVADPGMWLWSHRRWKHRRPQCPS